MRGIKQTNEYQRAIVDYTQMPKSVLAAIAYSFAMRILGADGDTPTLVNEIITEEWAVLHENGIVPQEPK